MLINYYLKLKFSNSWVSASNPSGFAAFLVLELKDNWGLNVIFNLTKTLSLWSTDPRLCSWDNLMHIEPHCPDGLMLKGVLAVQGHARSSYEAVLLLHCSSSKGVCHPYDQWYAGGEKVTLGRRSSFSQFFLLLGTQAFHPADTPYLAYCSYSVHA